MSSAPLRTPIATLVIEQLEKREMRLLALVVAVRKSLVPPQNIKGELPAMVQSVVRGLVAANQVADTDGTYSLIKKK